VRGSFKRYKYHPWVRGFKQFYGRFMIPLIIFQGIRTILLPTVFDVFLLALLVTLALSIFLDII